MKDNDSDPLAKGIAVSLPTCSPPLLDTLETSVQKSAVDETARRKRQSLKVAKQLRSIGYEARAMKIEQCSQMIYRRSFSCGHDSYVRHGGAGIFFRCKDKFCPRCNHVRSVTLARGLGRALEAYVHRKGLYAYHLVLTYRNMSELPDYQKIRREVKRLFDSKAKYRSKFWDRYGYHGALVNFEVTVSEQGEYHPHFHILLLTEKPIELIETGKHAGEFQNRVNQEISDMWLRITKDSFVVKGKSFDFSDMFEMVKYLTKGVDMIPDEQLAELVAWSNGKRFISLIGELHNNDLLKHLSEDQDCEDPEMCPDCGCNEFVDIPLRFDVLTGRYIEDEFWQGVVSEPTLRAP